MADLQSAALATWLQRQNRPLSANLRESPGNGQEDGVSHTVQAKFAGLRELIESYRLQGWQRLNGRNWQPESLPRLAKPTPGGSRSRSMLSRFDATRD